MTKTSTSHWNGKDRSIVLVTALDHGVGRRKKLHNNANDRNRIHGRLEHHRGSILASSARPQQGKVENEQHNGCYLEPQHCRSSFRSNPQTKVVVAFPSFLLVVAPKMNCVSPLCFPPASRVRMACVGNAATVRTQWERKSFAGSRDGFGRRSTQPLSHSALLLVLLLVLGRALHTFT